MTIQGDTGGFKSAVLRTEDIKDSLENYGEEVNLVPEESFVQRVGKQGFQ